MAVAVARAAALIPPLVWERPYAADAAPKSKYIYSVKQINPNHFWITFLLLGFLVFFLFCFVFFFFFFFAF